ncbi:MAG: zf-HC2 domain-containing protein [Candidatus Binatia bacterium]
MRCTRARKWMTAALDGEISPRRQRALDQHIERCPTCRIELEATSRLFRGIAALPREAEVPARLEQATLRAVRLMADEPAAQHLEWWRGVGVSLPAIAAAAAVAVVAFRVLQVPPVVHEWKVPTIATARRQAPGGTQGERATVAAGPSVAPATRVAGRRTTRPLPALDEAPDVFAEMEILRHMEKLRHFEAIQTTTVDDEMAPTRGEKRDDG